MSEVHLFVVWSEARHVEGRILDDLARRFRVLDVIEVTWTAEQFASNLTRFYGSALPAGSDKERHCGTGPFLVVVVEDAEPRYRMRRLSRGWGRVNAGVIDTRTEHRSWTGGGYRVHASETPAEADRDLVLLFGRRARDFLGSRPDPAGPRRHEADLIGTTAWDDREQLLLALEVTSGWLELPAPAGADLALAVVDRWWAEHVLGGREVDGLREVVVGGAPTRIALVEEPTRRPLAPRAARRLLRPARRVAGRVRREIDRRRRPRWGNLRRHRPFSDRYGYDRGTPVDRTYVHRCYESWRADITGAVLEVRDPEFTDRYGHDVTSIDLIDVDPRNTRATIVADLTEPGAVPGERWDCVVLPQTVHLVTDPAAAVGNAYRALRPGGVLLVTAPCLARVDPDIPDGDRWRFPPAGLRLLVEGACPGADVDLVAHGNLVSTMAFLLGLATHELRPEDLDRRDGGYPLVAGARVRRPGA